MIQFCEGQSAQKCLIREHWLLTAVFQLRQAHLLRMKSLANISRRRQEFSIHCLSDILELSKFEHGVFENCEYQVGLWWHLSENQHHQRCRLSDLISVSIINESIQTKAMVRPRPIKNQGSLQRHSYWPDSESYGLCNFFALDFCIFPSKEKSFWVHNFGHVMSVLHWTSHFCCWPKFSISLQEIRFGATPVITLRLQDLSFHSPRYCLLGEIRPFPSKGQICLPS